MWGPAPEVDDIGLPCPPPPVQAGLGFVRWPLTRPLPSGPMLPDLFGLPESGSSPSPESLGAPLLRGFRSAMCGATGFSAPKTGLQFTIDAWALAHHHQPLALPTKNPAGQLMLGPTPNDPRPRGGVNN